MSNIRRCYNAKCECNVDGSYCDGVDIVLDFNGICKESEYSDAQKHGWWLPPVIGSYGCTCSVCEMQADNDYNYCPHCGTKMDLEVEHG